MLQVAKAARPVTAKPSSIMVAAQVLAMGVDPYPGQKRMPIALTS